MHAADHMRIASVSKAFSGAAALTLVDQGVMSLDDTIGERLPGLPAAWHTVTLAQLLHHTSGLPDYTSSKKFGKALSDSFEVAPPPVELLSYVKNKPLRFTPDTRYRYSNSDNIAAGLMVEEATGASYEEALDTKVFGPAGLADTLMPSGIALRDPFIRGYQTAEDGSLEDVSQLIAFGGWAWASGGIESTPADLTRFVRAYMGGSLFGGRTRHRQRDFVHGASDPRGPGVNSAGLALFRYQTSCGTVYGHTGSIFGYTQLIAATPNGRRSLTFTINEQFSEELLPKLRRTEEAAVCAALARR
jgi:D-alanyl-D-alanine carboxypeptidase